MMENTVQKSKNEQFCINFQIPLWASSSEAESSETQGPNGLIEKTEKEFKNVTFDTPNSTKSLVTKIQNKLRSLHKEGKLDTATYKQLYPSGSQTPTANPVIKAHTPEKDYPIRVVTSHIGAP